MSLFALFLRVDAPDRWDLIVAAPWIVKDKKNAFEYFAKLLRSKLNEKELIRISRISFIEDNDPALEAIHKAIQVEHGDDHVLNSNFFGLEIREAHILTSKRA